MENKFVLQEEHLQLVVGKKTLGSLTTNAKQIKELVEKALPNYDIANYNEDNIDLAKKDKAMLNKASKLLNSKRIEIEKEFMKPFTEFKEIVADTVKLISACSAKIDSVVQESIEKHKSDKLADIQEYYNGKGFALVTLDRIFDHKWYNKTFKIKDVYADIDKAIAKIEDDLMTLEAIGDHVDLLKSLYLNTLDVNTTIQYANTLKENAAKAKAEAEKAKEEPIAESDGPSDENPFENVYSSGYNPEWADAGEAGTSLDTDPLAKVVSGPELLVRTLRVTATKEKIIALADFMNANGIQFEKIG